MHVVSISYMGSSIIKVLTLLFIFLVIDGENGYKN